MKDSTIGVAGPILWTYGYDGLERLVSVRRAGVLIARYGYDLAGRRIAKRVYSSASGGTVAYTRFVYHGDHVAFETDSSGTTGWRYTWGLGTDDLLAARDGAGNHYYPVQDKLGSIRGVVKRDGTVPLVMTFYPYGTVLDSAGPGLALRYRWTGREWDPETGWYFFRARYYDPQARRFTQEDPIGYGGGMNLYAYVGGQVLEARDPSGLGTATGNAEEYADYMRWWDGILNGGGGGYYLDGVPISSSLGETFLTGSRGFSVNRLATFNAWDILTTVEKNWTGNLVFDDPRVGDAFRLLRRGAYLSGDSEMQAMLNFAGNNGIALLTVEAFDPGALTWSSRTIVFGKGGIRIAALTEFGAASGPAAELRSIALVLIHELGHAVAAASPGPLNRQTPGVVLHRETYGGSYWENQWRRVHRCLPRLDYSVKPPC
jgi:RHS repeat-associated protein